MAISLANIERARERISGQIRRTPCERSATLSAMTWADVWLKFENLQFTSSFKERGALNRLLQLSAAQRHQGVIAMSAGNHAQALAYHGKRLGVPVTIVMPRSTPNTKVDQTRVHGAEVILHGDQFDEARSYTEVLAKDRELLLVHPFDDEHVVAGQGTLGLELLEQRPDFDELVVPVGGGGLIGGTALAIKACRPQTFITGVQVQGYDAAVQAFDGSKLPIAAGNTVAEGIAVKAPGQLTMPLLRAHVDAMCSVTEESVEQAVFLLLEVEKTVTEGAGAAGLALLLQQADRFRGKQVVVVLTGGNIDMMILSSILQRGMVRSHRLVRLRVEIPDLPGALGELTQLLGNADCNIVELGHQRAFAASSVRATQIEVSVQLRGAAQLDAVLAALRAGGYQATHLSAQ